MKNLIAFSAFATALSCAAAVPTVDAVSYAQDPATRRVTVTYKLTDADGIVTMDVLTNGVSIGAAHIRRTWGDVNRRIAADDEAVRTIWWSPDDDWPGQFVDDGTLSVKLTAWSPSCPPPYMAICIAVTNAPICYYVSEEAVPDGVSADKYKTDWLLMRKIEAAGKTWRMGCPRQESGATTRDNLHFVTLTNDYYIGVYPVTQRQHYIIYKAFNSSAASAVARPSIWKDLPDSDFRPVENISWEDLRGDGRTFESGYNWPYDGHAVNPTFLLGRLRKALKIAFDLPTEAQWEFACRAGCGDAHYYWNADPDKLAWYDSNSEVTADGVATRQTHPVGLKRPNAFGLYDMLGNVQEWCLDRYDTAYATNADGSPVLEPEGPCTVDEIDKVRTVQYARIRRGGSYDDPVTGCRSSAYYSNWSQGARNAILGFRLCCPANHE